MTIQEKTPQQRAAMVFESAGLGSRSAAEAARLLFETGMSFETAAVLGQTLGEECTATATSIREAANRYDRQRSGPRTTTAWGRPIGEAEGRQTTPSPRSAAGGKQIPHPERTRVIDGVLHHEVNTYEDVAEDEKPRRTPWGRKLED